MRAVIKTKNRGRAILDSKTMKWHGSSQKFVKFLSLFIRNVKPQEGFPVAVIAQEALEALQSYKENTELVITGYPAPGKVY